MIEQIVMSADGIEVQDGVPKEIKILPLGVVKSRKGTFLVDDESAEMILRSFNERQLDLVVDYEHQTMLNMQAPAGGWIRKLRKGKDAIIADVEWTDKAAQYLKNKEYRYLSPVIRVRKDRRVTAIHSVALTNVPAIDGMFAMCSDAGLDDFVKEDKMELKELAAILGLPEDATEEQVRSALKSAVQKKAEPEGSETPPAAETVAESTVANSTILGLLELPEDAKTEDVTAKIMSLKAGDETLAKRVEELEGQIRGKAADDAVETALKEGKVSAAQKEWARGYALKDPEGFAAFCAQAPAMVPQGRMELKDAKPEEKIGQSQGVILKNLGISEEDFRKYAAKEDE